MKDFADKVAVITGGAGGIGLAFAQKFGAAGCRVMLADIEGEALELAVRKLRDLGITARGHIADVTDQSSLEQLAAHTKDTFGNTHLLFNNAGVSITGPTWQMAPDDWRWVWDVNVWGVVNGIRAFLPAMIAHGEGGHIVNTGSLASFNGNGDHAPYCSSKAAVLGISQSLYSEMKAMVTGIGVSIVCPGMVDTKINQSWRNRPATDAPWSDREFADAEFRRYSDEFQGRGIGPEVIADSTLSGVSEDLFYIFSGDTWPGFMDRTLARTIRGENPLVMTWGEDRRPPEERADVPGSGIVESV